MFRYIYERAIQLQETLKKLLQKGEITEIYAIVAQRQSEKRGKNNVNII